MRTLPSSDELLARIKAHLAPPDERGCEVWLLSCNEHGYGQLRYRGRNYKVHRTRYKLEVGDPGSLKVRHTCDNPPCAALDHLVPGTQLDNMRDMAARGRAHKTGAKGMQHGMAKLTDEAVRTIRLDSRPYRVIATEHGVSPSAVKAIKRRISWRHLS